MTLTFDLDLDSVKTDPRAKYVGQRFIFYRSYTQTPTPDRVLYLNH